MLPPPDVARGDGGLKVYNSSKLNLRSSMDKFHFFLKHIPALLVNLYSTGIEMLLAQQLDYHRESVSDTFVIHIISVGLDANLRSTMIKLYTSQSMTPEFVDHQSTGTQFAAITTVGK